MFKRKRREKPLARHVMEKMVLDSEIQKRESERELIDARNIIHILNGIRMENHIVADLRKVLGGH